jgi:hypothetical protein
MSVRYWPDVLVDFGLDVPVAPLLPLLQPCHCLGLTIIGQCYHYCWPYQYWAGLTIIGQSYHYWGALPLGPCLLNGEFLRKWRGLVVNAQESRAPIF